MHVKSATFRSWKQPSIVPSSGVIRHLQLNWSWSNPSRCLRSCNSNTTIELLAPRIWSYECNKLLPCEGFVLHNNMFPCITFDNEHGMNRIQKVVVAADHEQCLVMTISPSPHIDVTLRSIHRKRFSYKGILVHTPQFHYTGNMSIRWCFLHFLLLCSTAFTQSTTISAQPATYTNPILNGVGADPYVYTVPESFPLLMHMTAGLYTMIAGITWRTQHLTTLLFSGVKPSRIGTRQRRSLPSITQLILLMHSESAWRKHSQDRAVQPPWAPAVCKAMLSKAFMWTRPVIQLLPKSVLCWLTFPAISGLLSCTRLTIPGILFLLLIPIQTLQLLHSMHSAPSIVPPWTTVCSS